MDSDSLESLSLARLAQLLQVESDGLGPLWSAADGAAALRHQLALPLLAELETLPGAERERLAVLAGGRTMLQAFIEPDVPAELLEVIKEFARHVREQSSHPLGGEPATVIYYAAIAAAMVGGVRITKLTDAELRVGYHWAAGWGGAEGLRATFEAAGSKLIQG